jgi:hypothetical protein
MKKALAATALVLGLGSPAWAGKPLPDPQLVEGKKQVSSGAYEAAIATLTGVVRRLGALSGREEDVAEAYLNLGIAYAGLGQLSPARSQFIQALMRDPSLELDPKTAPKAAVEAFEGARREGESEGVVSADRLPRSKHSTGKVLLAVGAVGAGVGAAAVGAAGGKTSGEATSPSAGTSFVIASASPYIELVTASPSAGTTLFAGAPISVTVKVVNTGTDSSHPQMLIEADAVTPNARTCLRGRTSPFSFLPGANVTWAFPLDLQCPAPFYTESLYVWLEDAITGTRPYFAVYRGGYRVIAGATGN